ncbi:beta-galactosidase [Nostocoides sp. F2B08]|uniref:beta-galactosidase n=1 Tax=Nostocoides sp. F2B08 TaxID=2653936 RepID=UPI00126347AB|nr:beta-galactosidase [Tetrasphaera sp. F2B08]KAB7743631.1 beta-galactosidase [Tetrasphaera sp. F2B08]
MRAWPTIAFGGDYNPEQWPREVWDEDVRLMQEAGVNIVTLGVFSWAHLEPRPGELRFDWLDEVIDLLHAGGIAVDLATATASPPPWLAHRHPEMLPVTAEGVTLWTGGRQAYCPSSPVYREHSHRIVRALAERYGSHPAVVMWHVNNEIGCHNVLCYCDESARAFRSWLEVRYGSVEALNEAWGTAFWSQRYDDFAEIQPPRAAPAFVNPTHQLDFHRFSSDAALAIYLGERDILKELTPDIPVTTNFMVMPHEGEMDYFRWGPELDVVANDHYLTAADPENHRGLAFSSDLVRGVAGGEPWLLMETSTSAVNWQPRNVAKRPGELLRSALQHVARGADGVLFFQWRASRAGAEKFHSGLVPHAGTDSRLWREVVGLGRTLAAISEVAGARSRNEVAVLFDWQAWWACELDAHPSEDVRYWDTVESVHRSLTDCGIGVDVVHPETDLTGYRVIVVPVLYLVTDAGAAAVRAAAESGAHVVVTYFSGIVDESDHIRLGGYPGAFREMLGIVSEEFTPLRENETVTLSDGSRGTVWAEDVRSVGADVLATFVDGPVPGAPAITRNRVGAGSATYLATRLDQRDLDRVLAEVVGDAGVPQVADVPPGVEALRRHGEDGTSWLFLVNHTDEPVEVACSGHDLVADRQASGVHAVAAGSVAVLREHRG